MPYQRIGHQSPRDHAPRTGLPVERRRKTASPTQTGPALSQVPLSRCRWIRGAYLAYLTVVGSALGWILHRDPDTYRYIPASIRRYPGARGVADKMESRGFTHVRIVPLLFGLMTLHQAQRADHR